MFEKILIANRGEIACRVIRTARRMGIATVAIYSEADVGALHVQQADEACYVGPAPSSESYLNADAIINACQTTGAQAVHPGYGFLSENAAFAQRLSDEGIAFIGPPVGAIESMGDKITSKLLAAEAGVNTIPGYTDVVRDADHAVEISEGIGYPVMLKASAGGGGKGMRVARDRAECQDGFERATSEARSSFGDDRIFIEKFVEEPRHIEIQVLADRHGHTLYLGERECSIQRRHQKVIEEAPSSFIDANTRRAMGEQAVALAEAVNYCSAGTVEFVVDAERNFFFLEMNTRLQVEHPVTEVVTGIDLVEQMLRVAAGETLSFSQEDITLTGWAMEARIYAEDPFRSFLPSVGRLSHYEEPADQQGVRVDAGVFEGGEVSIYYDPMIAKLIGFGVDRNTAIARLRDALDRYVIRGTADNIPFLSALFRHPRFIEGRINTGFIDEEYAEGFTVEHVRHEDPRALVALSVMFERTLSGDTSDRAYGVVSIGEQARESFAASVANGQISVDGVSYAIETAWRPGLKLCEVSINGSPQAVQVERDGIDWFVSQMGDRMRIRVMSPRAAELLALMPVKVPPDLSKFLLSPMPGLLMDVRVASGDPVEIGTDLAVVEAMKMENVLRAERAGTVKTVLAEVGASLAVDEPIIEFE
ncbi:MAG: acetyl/propionyl/methylcrotonyl-CoA carboxylase subunit alpha [Chromatiales bacterium]|jgi:propionyl-CoA carboxylase alpha chain|nr:acetyl/propionyl/methylcrotonyl-CoA carboxylase subunit alpha [Chromatiales bacterium]